MPKLWRWSADDRLSAAEYWVDRVNSGDVKIDKLTRNYLIREYSTASPDSHYGQIIDLLCELNQRLTGA